MPESLLRQTAEIIETLRPENKPTQSRWEARDLKRICHPERSEWIHVNEPGATSECVDSFTSFGMTASLTSPF
jgi:hypothetical protein